MIKLAVTVRRKAGMAVVAFQEYWGTEHARIVRRLPGLRRYVQSHTLLGGYRKGEPAWDGIAELWFDDTAALRALRGTPEQAAVDADEAKFIEPGTRKILIVDDHVIIDGPIPRDGVKNITFLNRRPDVPVDAFQKYFRETHGPIAAKNPHIRRYVQSHVRPSAYTAGRAPAYDGLAITWFDDTQAMRESAKTAEYARTRADEPSFLAAERPFIITRETVVV